MAEDDTGTTQHEGDEAPGVVREVELPAAPEDVWEALTAPDQVEAWFGAAVAWDLQPGGPVSVGPGDDGSGPRRGEVDEVEPARRLRFRWWPSEGGDDSGTSAVTYELEPVPGGTRLTVTEIPHLAPSALAAGPSAITSPWDCRLLGLWVGSCSRALVRA